MREGTSSGNSDVTSSMVKIEVLDRELAEIGWRRFKLSWCTKYSPKRYQRGLNLLIHKEPNDFRPHRLIPILLFDIEEKMNNKHLGRMSMYQDETLDGIYPEQCGIRKAKFADTQALNKKLFYDII